MGYLKLEFIGRDLFIDYGISIITPVVKCSSLSIEDFTALSLDNCNVPLSHAHNTLWLV